jgi:hypothetical protein
MKLQTGKTLTELARLYEIEAKYNELLKQLKND